MSQVFISYRHCQHGHSDRVKNLMHTLRQDGIEKALQGLTDMNEVLAATNL